MSTKADLRRYEKLMRVGCIACHIDGRYAIGDVHHSVHNGYRRLSGGNKSTMILCLWHHRGYVPEGYTVESASEVFGPSLFHESKAFHDRYGDQRQLLILVNELLETQVYS